ncbi:MAG: hypothetical protein HZA15_12130 [Nitrospirae bacterium]|nr:hypothetical protein [Nitrospirota bacterium]
MKSFALNFLAILVLFTLSPPCAAGNFQSDSKRLSNSKMDIVITEIDRRPRTSVLDIKVKAIGSSVGSSFFIVCSLRDLAKQRGGFRYIVKIEERPGRGQMLVGFLISAEEPPEILDVQFAGATVVDLEQFAPICDTMK